MDYAIIRVGNKQHRVRDGETLVVDRVHTDEGATFTPDLLLGGDGVKVTVKVLSHERGPKIRIGKYRKRTGYKRHNGFRAATTRIEISLGTGKSAPAKRAEQPTAPPPAAVAEPDTAVEAPVAEAEAAAAPETVEAAEAPQAPAEAPAGLPEGYENLTVAAIAADAKTWELSELEAAVAYEQAHAKRKGALAALESALAAKETG
jgi:large subunit ribosomal protein L21